ncbi:hypothetical protein SGLAD_v1c03500 [Spiroplasma gladiatoris]|uniref:Uncharacterized protein n=1 Tax=Spiroplasma gladiatoris TaxID=2143 RepID=A0A4V1AQ78_9MOLU|nr:hypothetical protein [Spiroplasma gladiatoris]QBQ07549.1 hypothetical protein SGLAD_v1c03500 [Spiroplasma gladiatoris]
MINELQHKNIKDISSSFYFTKLNLVYKNEENLAFFVNSNLIKNKITNKYFRLLNYSILSNDFDLINNHIKNEFPNSKIKHLLKLIAKTNNVLFENKFKNQVDYESMFKLNIYCQLFLIYIRYNPNIWLSLDQEYVKQVSKTNQLDWSIINYIINYHVLKDCRFDLTYDQKYLVNTLMSLSLEDLDSRNKMKKILEVPILATKIFMIQREAIKKGKSLRENKKKYKHLLFSTAMQLIIHFINNNIDDINFASKH